MPRYDDVIKEEARALYLQGMGYKTIATKLREQHKNKLSFTTIKRWADKESWKDILEKQRKAIRSETNRNATRSNIKNIKTLQAIRSKFISQLETSSSEIRPYEIVGVIKELQRLEGALDIQNVLIEEIAELLPEAMKKAKIPQKKINLTIRYWVEMVQEME
tara:strand:+ start:3807 stop:4292 length:486 start_codon:yes stop_codon:yes gene_type:complete